MLDHHQPVGPRVGQRQQHRMSLAQEQPAAGPEQVGDHLGPAVDVGQPAQRPDAGEDQVVAARAEDLDGVVDVGDVEVDVGAALAARSRATVIAGAEKSSPDIRAPSRLSETVSVPMWHCRWTPRRPEMSPSRGRSKRTTSERWFGSLAKRSRPYSGDAAWAGARSSHISRLTSELTGSAWQNRAPGDYGPVHP